MWVPVQCRRLPVPTGIYFYFYYDYLYFLLSLGGVCVRESVCVSVYISYIIIFVYKSARVMWLSWGEALAAHRV